MGDHVRTRAAFAACCLAVVLGGDASLADSLEQRPDARHGRSIPRDEHGRISFTLDHGLEAVAPNNRASLHIGALGGMRGQLAVDPDGAVGAAVMLRFLRLRLEGHLGVEWIRYLFQVEFANNPRVLDLYLQAAPHEAAGLRLGQMLVPFGYSWEGGPCDEMFPDSGPAKNYVEVGRDAGALLLGSVAHERFQYFAGGYVGAPISLEMADQPVRDGFGVVRLVAAPFGAVPENQSPWSEHDVPARVSFAVGGYYGNIVRSIERFDRPTTGFTTAEEGLVRDAVAETDVMFVWNRLSIDAEVSVVNRHLPVRNVTYDGIESTAQAGVFVAGRVLQLAARWSYLDPALGSTGNEFYAIEGMVAGYFVGPHLALKLRYGAGHAGATPLLGTFSPGWTQIVSLQAQAYF